MKRTQLKIPDLCVRCENPACRKHLNDKKAHARTCSPACRKAVWRAKNPKANRAARDRESGRGTKSRRNSRGATASPRKRGAKR